jgi:Arc/MetJ-type ribon-helix-helix transcriptional regulator
VKDKNFTFPMPDDMKQWLEQYAASEYLSMSQVVRMAIREFIKSKEGVQ